MLVNRKVTVMKQSWMSFNREHPHVFRFKYSHNQIEAWRVVNMRKRGVSTGLPLLLRKYRGGRAINGKKLADILKLLKFIPPVHYEFYTSLTAENACFDSDTEYMDMKPMRTRTKLSISMYVYTVDHHLHMCACDRCTLFSYIQQCTYTVLTPNSIPYELLMNGPIQKCFAITTPCYIMHIQQMN